VPPDYETSSLHYHIGAIRDDLRKRDLRSGRDIFTASGPVKHSQPPLAVLNTIAKVVVARACARNVRLSFSRAQFQRFLEDHA
jgi:hypothetical protein